MPAGIKANSDGSAAIQVGGTDVITLTSGGAATFVTSPTTVQAGTAAAPSITFSGDTNTGIYSPGADQVAIATGGSQRATVDSAGNFIAAAGSQNLGSTAARWGSVYATEFADGTNQLVGSASVQARFGFGSAWTSLAFATSGTERARFNNTGAFVLAGGDTSANGIGITFPATQSASSNANTLDDYEEGTFTATLSPGTSGSITLNSIYDLLSYTKIGRLVTITGQLVVSSVSSPVGSLVNLNNLPFPCADTGELSERAGGCTTYVDNSANAYYTQGMLLAAGDTFTRILMSEAGRVAAIAVDDGFVFSFSYIAAT